MLLALLALLLFNVGADAELPLPQEAQIAIILINSIITAISTNPTAESTTDTSRTG